eukprot:TRINITY_DN33040_c0_g1_i1.p1 TRINITY_DN33040_c0_g1~~TRINITY_DN33040_c0_g1_i1.p1  ORF type:complete len:635 (+),score=195.80 TRINITY_DN33040_c0_g1_i1:54-1907(+)
MSEPEAAEAATESTLSAAEATEGTSDSLWMGARAEWTNKLRKKAGMKEDPELMQLAQKANEHRRREEDEFAADVRVKIAAAEAEKRRLEEEKEIARRAAAAAGRRSPWLKDSSAPRKRMQAAGDDDEDAKMRAEAFAEIQRMSEELDVVRALYQKRCDEVIQLKKAVATPFGLPVELPDGIGDEREQRLEEQAAMLLAKESRLGGLEMRMATVTHALLAMRGKLGKLKEERRRVHADALNMMNFRADFSTTLLSMKESITLVESEFITISIRLAAVMKERDAVRVELLEVRKELQSTRSVLRDTQDELAEVKEKHSKFEERMQTLEDKYAESEEKLAEARAEIRQRDEQNRKQMEELKEAHAKQIREERDQHRQEAKRMEREVTALSEQVASAGRAREEVERQRNEILKQLKQERESYEKKLDEKRAELQKERDKAKAVRREERSKPGRSDRPGSGGGGAGLTEEQFEALMAQLQSPNSRAHGYAQSLLSKFALRRGFVSTRETEVVHRHEVKKEDPHAGIPNVVDRLYARDAAWREAWDRKRAGYLSAKEDHAVGLSELLFTDEEPSVHRTHDQLCASPGRSFVDLVRRRKKRGVGHRPPTAAGQLQRMRPLRFEQ